MKLLLPPLTYDHAALEPHIDARTMVLHYDKHHAGCVANLNSALEKCPGVHHVNDVWEHGYYLKYENRRHHYLRA